MVKLVQQAFKLTIKGNLRPKALIFALLFLEPRDIKRPREREREREREKK